MTSFKDHDFRVIINFQDNSLKKLDKSRIKSSNSFPRQGDLL